MQKWSHCLKDMKKTRDETRPARCHHEGRSSFHSCGMLFLIHEVKFLWAAMITPLLPAGRRGENTALIRCNLISDMLAAYAAFAVRVFIASSGAWCTFHVWEEEWAVFIVMSTGEKLFMHAARLRMGGKSGRYFFELSSLGKARAHSTFTFGREEWTV